MIRSPNLVLTGQLADAPGALAAHIGAFYGAHDMAQPQPQGGIRVEMSTGALSFTPTDSGLAIAITAISETDLFVLREAVASLIEGFDGTLTARLAWDRALTKTAHPPNFRAGHILAATPCGQSYLRLRIAAQNLSPFAVGGLHLRLLLPADDRAPVWPTVSEAGRTVWPEGPDKPHDPVYTIRAIDPVAGWVEVDVYLHGRGRTCAWTANARPGMQIGLVGPGGGFFPKARHLVLAGDETALPAIARILENAEPDTQGLAMILVPAPGDIQPLAAPAGIRLKWLFRSAGDTLTHALAAADLPGPDLPGGRHLWIASERFEAQTLRSHYRETHGWSRENSTIAAYWTDNVPD